MNTALMRELRERAYEMLRSNEKLARVTRAGGESTELMVSRESAADLIVEAFLYDLQGANSEWEYGVHHVDVDGYPTMRTHSSLDEARNDFATCGMNCSLARRKLNDAPGPWVPLDEVSS